MPDLVCSVLTSNFLGCLVSLNMRSSQTIILLLLVLEEVEALSLVSSTAIVFLVVCGFFTYTELLKSIACALMDVVIDDIKARPNR